MEIIQNFVDAAKYNIKCPYEMIPEFIVVHNTYNDASARNEIAYMIRNNKQVSFHYAVDGKEIVQGIPEDRNAWHAGDGGKGSGNRKGIAIEICYSKSGGDRFLAAEKLAAKFIAYKLKEKGWGIDKVKRHQDFAKKDCPHRTNAMGWERFLQMVQVELDALDSAKINEKGTVEVKVSVLKKGVKGSQVKAMQTLLIGHGYSCGSSGVDGSFGGATDKALRAYQKEKGLAVDGSCGPATWKSLLGVST